MEETENYVTLAYDAAQEELNIFLEMIERVNPAPSDDLEELKRWRASVTGDLSRMEKRINISKEYLRARERSFHYEAKRLRTTDRIDRLRLWNRQKKAEVIAHGCQGGEPGRDAAQRRFQTEKRVILKCYDLEELWDKALRREKASKLEGEDLSSGCETDIED